MLLWRHCGDSRSCPQTRSGRSIEYRSNSRPGASPRPQTPSSWIPVQRRFCRRFLAGRSAPMRFQPGRFCWRPQVCAFSCWTIRVAWKTRARPSFSWIKVARSKSSQTALLAGRGPRTHQQTPRLDPAVFKRGEDAGTWELRAVDHGTGA